MKTQPFYSFVRACCSGLFRVFYKHRVVGAENLPEGPAILAPNHSSYLDPPIVAVSCADEVHFLARASLFRPFGFGSLIRMLNAHPLSGASHSLGSMKLIAQLLKSGYKVVVFPEGTRSKDGALLPVKQGVAMLALQANCPIVPVWIKGSGSAWGRESAFPKVTGSTLCVFGKPILPTEGGPELSSRERIDYLSTRLEEELRELQGQWETN